MRLGMNVLIVRLIIKIMLVTLKIILYRWKQMIFQLKFLSYKCSIEYRILNVQLENHGLRKSSLSLSDGESKRMDFIVYSAKYCDHNIRQNATIITLQSNVISIEYIRHS